MTLSRREFVATASLSLASAASGSFAWLDGKRDHDEKYSNWGAVRAEFDLAPGWLHFSQFYLVSHPRTVREAIERFRRLLDANPLFTVEHGMGFDQEGAETLPLIVQREAAAYRCTARGVGIYGQHDPGPGPHLHGA